MKDLIIGIIWLGFFAAVLLGWYFYLKARNKERMALIKRDKDVSEIYSKYKIPWLKLGIILAGASLGYLASTILMNADKGIVNSIVTLRNIVDSFVFGVTLLFTSVSILIAYFVDKPKSKK